MLDTRFPRVPGDVGNPETWGFPVQYAVVAGATPQAIVCEDTSPFVQAFIDEGHKLVAAGCTGIATTCGFLAVMRPRLAAVLGVPVAASALEQAQQIRALLAPDRHVGVLTISKGSLSNQHLLAAGVPQDTFVMGVEATGFAFSVFGNKETLDVSLARAELVTAARELVQQAPQTGAILLECTNMVPYSRDIHGATGVPVYSIYSYLKWFHESLAPHKFRTS